VNIEVLTDTFRHLSDCCLHEPQWEPEEVTAVLAALWCGCGAGCESGWEPLEDYKEYPDSDSVFAVSLDDGTFGLLGEGEDYTGHGCRCSSWTGRYPSIPDLLQFGCEDVYRDKMAEALGVTVSE
jgi:hypothetical protein